MAKGIVMHVNQADAGAGRKAEDGRDVFLLIGRAIDEAAESIVAQGMSMSIWIDPALRRPREIDATHLADTVKRLTAVALSGAHARTISIRAEPEADIVRVSASAGQGRTWAVTLNAPPSRPKVLVIDDDPAARVELAAAMEAAGYACKTVTGAEAAVHALFAGGPWAAVLIELYLESGDALELAGLADGPVFAMSARDRTVSGWALREAGFHGCFAKPVPMARFRAALAA